MPAIAPTSISMSDPMIESAALLGAVSICLFWTAWREMKQSNPRDGRFMALVGAFLMAGAGASAIAAAS